MERREPVLGHGVDRAGIEVEKRPKTLDTAERRGLEHRQLAVRREQPACPLGVSVQGLQRDAGRRPHERDGRAVLVEPTAAGRRLLERARARRIDLVASRLGDLGEEELALLRRAAELLEERFALRPWRAVERS